MKRIVICSDGTWNTPDLEAPTSVTRMARAVLPTAPGGTAQVVFYDAGVGTEGSRLWRLIGAISGKGLEKNIRDCYRFLVHNYEEGDEIYLFGFSRGAYTVRSLDLIPGGPVFPCGDSWDFTCSHCVGQFHLDGPASHPGPPEECDGHNHLCDECAVRYFEQLGMQE